METVFTGDFKISPENVQTQIILGTGRHRLVSGCGVPQGSIMGPLPFIQIQIIFLSKSISTNSHFETLQEKLTCLLQK